MLFGDMYQLHRWAGQEKLANLGRLAVVDVSFQEGNCFIKNICCSNNLPGMFFEALPEYNCFFMILVIRIFEGNDEGGIKEY